MDTKPLDPIVAAIRYAYLLALACVGIAGLLVLAGEPSSALLVLKWVGIAFGALVAYVAGAIALFGALLSTIWATFKRFSAKRPPVSVKGAAGTVPASVGSESREGVPA